MEIKMLINKIHRLQMHSINTLPLVSTRFSRLRRRKKNAHSSQTSFIAWPKWKCYISEGKKIDSNTNANRRYLKLWQNEYYVRMTSPLIQCNFVRKRNELWYEDEAWAWRNSSWNMFMNKMNRHHKLYNGKISQKQIKTWRSVKITPNEFFVYC